MKLPAVSVVFENLSAKTSSLKWVMMSGILMDIMRKMTMVSAMESATTRVLGYHQDSSIANSALVTT